jgi:hypothetical protein
MSWMFWLQCVEFVKSTILTQIKEVVILLNSLDNYGRTLF